MKVSRNFKRPVNWLLGRQMIATLKETFLYTAYGDKMDPKDWMKADRIPRSTLSKHGDHFPSGEFWFDYLSDTGDGMKAVYNLAYLCMSDLYLDESTQDVDRNPRDGQSTALPRGAFLFIGGDTSYHIADYQTLADARLQPPVPQALRRFFARSAGALHPRFGMGSGF